MNTCGELSTARTLPGAPRVRLALATWLLLAGRSVLARVAHVGVPLSSGEIAASQSASGLPEMIWIQVPCRNPCWNCDGQRPAVMAQINRVDEGCGGRDRVTETDPGGDVVDRSALVVGRGEEHGGAPCACERPTVSGPSVSQGAANGVLATGSPSTYSRISFELASCAPARWTHLLASGIASGPDALVEWPGSLVSASFIVKSQRPSATPRSNAAAVVPIWLAAVTYWVPPIRRGGRRLTQAVAVKLSVGSTGPGS